MDLDSLKAFCIVVETGSISKAAKKLFVSQPSLSVKIQDLENQCQSTLLERTNKGVKMTEAGQVVYQHAQKILLLSENIERELDRSRSQDVLLKLGASSTVGNYALPCTVYNFKEKYPHCQIQLDTYNTQVLIEKVVNKQVDIGIAEGPLASDIRSTLNKEQVQIKRVITNELILVVHNSDKWKHVSKVSLDQSFKSLPFIIREKGSGIRTTMEMVLAAKGLALDELNVVLELHSTNAIISAVTSDKGAALLPRMAIHKELHYKILKQIPVDDVRFRHDITTLCHHGDTRKPLHSTFLNFIHSRERGFC